MKKTIIKLVTVVALCTMGAAMAYAVNGDPGTGIYHSPHDLTNGPGGTKSFPALPGWATQGVDPQQRLCAYCHTPHHATTSAEASNGFAPLWSHAISQATYDPYQSSTFTFVGGASMDPDPLIGPSRLCMSCHDGITAVDNYYGKTTGTSAMQNPGTSFMTMPVVGNGTLTIDGSTNHPIGFQMTDVIPGYSGATFQDPSIKSLTNTSPYLGNTNTNLFVIDRLYQKAFLTCSTCHDVHNTLNTVSTQPAAVNMLLLGSQKNSALCVTCHTQGGVFNDFNY